MVLQLLWSSAAVEHLPAYSGQCPVPWVSSYPLSAVHGEWPGAWQMAHPMVKCSQPRDGAPYGVYHENLVANFDFADASYGNPKMAVSWLHPKLKMNL